MRKSVSRKIENPNDGYLYVQVDGHRDLRHRLLIEQIGRVPKKDYRVTYALSQRGGLVIEKWKGSPLAGVRGQPVCFLPVKWIGRRVRRMVRVFHQKKRR